MYKITGFTKVFFYFSVRQVVLALHAVLCNLSLNVFLPSIFKLSQFDISLCVTCFAPCQVV